MIQQYHRKEKLDAGHSLELLWVQWKVRSGFYM